MNDLKQSKTRGFTIIEVMIVLAIAGLIMLIVFLAVPALQRTSRNTQRKNDVASVAAAITNYINNNGGSMPKSVAASGSNLQICAATCTGNTELANLGYYDASVASAITLVTNSAAPATPTKDTIVIDVGYGCNATNTGLGTTASRTAAILYAVETSSSTIAQQCSEQ